MDVSLVHNGSNQGNQLGIFDMLNELGISSSFPNSLNMLKLLVNPCDPTKSFSRSAFNINYLVDTLAILQ
jgi:hypothetical protein